ncbi:crossover junction endodeoxyribonuclease RuvC [Thermodesulfovibrio hydrogeniphilus]
MRIIGIDPGSRHFGYGIVSYSMEMIHAGTLHLAHNINIPERLNLIYQTLNEIIEKYQPNEMAIEKAFVGRTIPSSFVLTYARAIALLVAAQHQIPVFEYSSTEIKKAITGYGRADKIQVRSMVRHFLNCDGKFSYDSSDALAVAICHINSKSLLKVLK